MIQVAGGDLNVVNLETALDKVMKANARSEFIKRNREIGILHLAGERIAQRLTEPRRAVDVPLTTTNKQRCKERESLNVIPVRVADQEAAPHGSRGISQQGLAEIMGTRATVDDH